MNQVVQNATQQVRPTAPANASGSKTGTFIKNFEDTGIVILVVLVMIVIIVILVYIIRLFKSTALQRVDLLDKLVPLDNRTSLPFIIPAGKMAVTSRGQEFSYSFWIYLSENYEATNMHKVIFMRGGAPNALGSVTEVINPIIMMDKASNIMYFAVSTTRTGTNNLINDIAMPGNPTRHLVAKVEYVPLQRWIHFTMVVRDNMMTIYMDGDVYSISSTSEIPSSVTDPRPLIRGGTGEGNIGNPATPIRGFLSKFEFYNYALSHKQIQSMYYTGPVNKSMLSYFGVGNYGVRSPIYSLEDSK
jgi:hypothetical protein